MNQKTQQLSASEVSIRRKPYHDNLKIINAAMDAHYKNMKELILDSARKLDKSNTIEKKNIGTQIMRDMYKWIQLEMITPNWIDIVLPAEYKIKGRGRKRGITSGLKLHELSEDINNLLSEATGIRSDMAQSMPVEQLIRETTDFRQRLIMAWPDYQVHRCDETLHYLVPVLEDTMHMLDKESKSRREKAKLLSK